MKILAIETSCDETAAAVMDGTKVLSHVVASSTLKHRSFGGIVPEIAAREQLAYIIPVVMQTLYQYAQTLPDKQYSSLTIEQFNQKFLNQFIRDTIDAIAVTVGPGLIGSLLVGIETAKTISMVTAKPIIPVNHVIAHMYSNFVNSKVKMQNSKIKHLQPLRQLADHNLQPISFPAISLVASGGHTELYLMKNERDLAWLGGTLDDAAGEAFDKLARLLGFENRGGAAIEEAASTHNSSLTTHNLSLPRPLLYDKSLNFSFSGLKTAVMREWKKYSNLPPTTYHLPLQSIFSYEIQEAITDVLVTKTLHAAQMHGAKSILLSGGVAANKRLKEKLSQQLKTTPPTGGSQLITVTPPASLCTDNAVMIGSYAHFKGTPTDWRQITANPDMSVEDNV